MSVNDLGTLSTWAWFHSRQFCSGSGTQACHYLLPPIKGDFFAQFLKTCFQSFFSSLHLLGDGILTNTLN